MAPRAGLLVAAAAAAVASVRAQNTVVRELVPYSGMTGPDPWFFKGTDTFDIAVAFLSDKGATKSSTATTLPAYIATTAQSDGCSNGGWEIAKQHSGIKAVKGSPNVQLLNDIPVERIIVCPDGKSVFHDVMTPSSFFAFLLASNEMVAEVDSSVDRTKLPAPYKRAVYAFSDTLAAKAVAALAALRPCGSGESDSCSKSVVARTALPATDSVIAEASKQVASESASSAITVGGGRFRGAHLKHAGGQSVLEPVDESEAALLEVQVDAATAAAARPTFYARGADPFFDIGTIVVPGAAVGLLAATTTVDLRSLANCYAYAGVSFYIKGKRNRRGCHPGRAGGASLAGAWSTPNVQGGPYNQWTYAPGAPDMVPIAGGGGDTNELNIAPYLANYVGGHAPMILAANVPAAVCAQLRAAMIADGFSAAGVNIDEAHGWHEVGYFAHRWIKMTKLAGPPAGRAYHVITTANALQQVAVGGVRPVGSIVVRILDDMVDYHFHRRNVNDATTGAVVWSDKNGGDFVHGSNPTATSNDEHYLNLGTPNLHNVFTALPVGGHRFGVIGAVECGQLFGKKYHFVPAASLGNAVGLLDCA